MMRFDVASHMYILMPLVIIVVGIGVISTFVFITQHTEDLLESDFSMTQIMLTNHLQEEALHLSEANLSIHSVARIIASFDKNLSSSSVIENEVLVVAFPGKNFMLLLQKMKLVVVFLLSFFIIIAIIGSCISSKLFRRLQRQKTYTLANLIKQKEATQQAERKSMNKSIAFASASHDMRASLAGITGLLRLCHDDVTPDSDVSRNLIQMDQCASKLLGILNSVLDTSKVEAGKMQLEDVEFNMAQAIEESVDLFHVVALAKGIEMPTMDGYEATKCIRVEEKKYDIHIPIIALSAHATPDETKKILLCGMDFHLTKPLEINKLLEIIKLISQK